MTNVDYDTGRGRTAETRQRVWMVVASPVVWGTHFMASYITAALWCGVVVGRDGSLSTARLLILGYTVVALAAIAVMGWMGWRAQRLRGGEPPHDADSPEDRHRFLGFATVLLSGLSAVATIYSALAAWIVRTCQ